MKDQKSMEKKLLFALVAIVVICLVLFAIAYTRAVGAETEHNVPEYAHDEYAIGESLHVKTQQICITPESHSLPVDWGIMPVAKVIHTISAPSRVFSGTLDIGRLAVWGYTLESVEVYNTASYSYSSDKLNLYVSDGAVRVTLISDTCIFRFPRVVLEGKSKQYMNVFVPLNGRQDDPYPLPK